MMNICLRTFRVTAYAQSLIRIKFQVFRHGARTPADTYPTDPHINETFQPYGWGQITNVLGFYKRLKNCVVIIV